MDVVNITPRWLDTQVDGALSKPIHIIYVYLFEDKAFEGHFLTVDCKIVVNNKKKKYVNKFKKNLFSNIIYEQLAYIDKNVILCIKLPCSGTKQFNNLW